jgi:hypothetical protein
MPLTVICWMVEGSRPGDPAAGDVVGQRLVLVVGNAVEADRRHRRAGRHHRFDLVVDLEIRRHVETDAETAMQEGLAANIALFRAVAVEQAVDAVEIVTAPGVADLAFLPEGARMIARKLDALRRVRVAGQEVEALVGIGIDRHEAAVARHRIQEPSGRVGIVAGLAEHAHADHVGLQFLLPREGREPAACRAPTPACRQYRSTALQRRRGWRSLPPLRASAARCRDWR